MEFFLRNKIRPLFAFLLVTAFLVLSYCPLRRAIQDVLGRSTRTQASGSRQQQLVALCQGISDRTGTNLIKPEAAAQVKAPVFAILVAWACGLTWRFYFIRQRHTPVGDFSLTYLDPVPIYLRNRIFLI